MAAAPSVQITRYPAQPDDDLDTQQTVERMCALIREDAGKTSVLGPALEAWRTWGRGHLDCASKAWAVWWWAKHNLELVDDDEVAARPVCFDGAGCVAIRWNNDRQLLFEPSLLVRMNPRRARCADFTSLICCMLKSLRVPFEIVTVKASPSEPNRWSHVYAQAVLEDGSRMPLDASHGDYPGWEVPAQHTFGYQVWDESGRRLTAQRSRSGLTGYARRGLGDTQCYIDADGVQRCDEVPSLTVPTSSAPGFNWGNLFGSLATQWTQIGSRVIAPTTTITTPQGTIVTPGTLPSGASYLSPIGGSLSMGTILVIGIVGLGAVALLSSRR